MTHGDHARSDICRLLAAVSHVNERKAKLRVQPLKSLNALVNLRPTAFARATTRVATEALVSKDDRAFVLSGP